MKGGKKDSSAEKKRDIVYNAIKFFYFETPNDNASSLIYVTKAAITDIEGRWKIIYFCNFFLFFFSSFFCALQGACVIFCSPAIRVTKYIFRTKRSTNALPDVEATLLCTEEKPWRWKRVQMLAIYRQNFIYMTLIAWGRKRNKN